MRVLQAPTEALPELAQFLEPFHIHFARSEGPAALERYLTGLLTEQPNKNCDTIAQVVPGTSEQRLQGLPDIEADDVGNVPVDIETPLPGAVIPVEPHRRPLFRDAEAFEVDHCRGARGWCRAAPA